MEMKLTQRFQLQRPETDFEISPAIPPEEMARRVRLAFKRMPEESALIVFAKVMTSDVPHEMKVAVWDAVRYSHIWWHVDEMLKGDVMENPIVQCAFYDTVPMRFWRVERSPYYLEDDAVLLPTGRNIIEQFLCLRSRRQKLIKLITACPDVAAAEHVKKWFASYPALIRDFVDMNGNGILWYLTYRDDQQAEGGFACPETEKILINFGADPNHRNKLGLSWNDVARHVNRPDQSFIAP